MLNFFKPGKKVDKAELLYAEAIPSTAQILKSPPLTRSAVAARADTPPDLLFALAADPVPGVRREVAANPGTPVVVTQVLARDEDLDVRSVLLRRLVALLPELPDERHGELYELTVKALETLARDQVRAVREALASTLKDIAYAPLSVIRCLARDVEQTVAGPVLQLCACLSDSDLLEIIARQPKPWALAAIAARGQVSATIANAIVDTGDVQAGSILLDNHGAVIEEETLAHMVEDAAGNPAWQEKLAVRPHLPRQLALRLAEFVDGSIMTLLEKRRDFDAQTIAEVSSVTRRRLTYLAHMEGQAAPQDIAAKLLRDGRLGEELILDAISWNDRPFLFASLAILSRVSQKTVESVLGAQNARVITALSWKAGLSMRVALQLQMRIAGISGRDVLNAKNGTAYPLSDDDMLWQLEYVGAIPQRRTG